MTSQQQKIAQAKARHNKQLVDLSQPYLFRDKSLIQAENLLLFSDLYTSIWQSLAIISVSIHAVSTGISISESQLKEEVKLNIECE